MVRAIVVGAVCLALLSTSTGCERRAPSEPDSAGEASTQVPTRSLSEVSSSIVRKIEVLETKKDVTCWTSFRQLDQFIATKAYSEFATLAKIESQKHMVRAVWAKASAKQPVGLVTAEDVKGAIALREVVVPEEERKELEEFATTLGMRDFEDYRKTGEHYRVLLAVVMDEQWRGGQLRPLSDEAEDELAQVAMQLSLELLKESGKVATGERSPFIEGTHVEKAHVKLAQEYGLTMEVPSGEPADPAAAAASLEPVTRQLIDAKVAALDTFNRDDPRTPYQAKSTLDAINRVIEVPVTAEGLARFGRDLRSFVRFAAGGLEPMRSDNYLSDGSFARSKVPRRLYVDAVWMENTLLQLFPHVVMPNGDIKLRLEPNPGTIAAAGRQPRDILLLDHQQNAIRDSAIHWKLLAAEFKQRPFALDPFAAEMLSEALSTMLTHYLWEGARIARELGKAEIDADVAAKVRDRTYVMVMPRGEESRPWSEADDARKKAALAGYSSLFRDVTVGSGLPAKLQLDVIAEDVVKADIQRVMGSGVALGDFDGDGLPDVFVAGEGLARLYRNAGAMRFADETAKRGLPEDLFDSRHALFVDLDADGDLDLLVVRSAHPSMLFENRDGTFVDVTESAGITTHDGAHVASVFDADGDRDLDIYIGYYGSDEANQGQGSVLNRPAIDGRNGSPNQLWRNDGGSFEEVGKESGVADVGWALAAAAFDYDSDGDLDLYVANDFGRNALLANDGKGSFEDVSHATHTGDRGSGMNVSLTDVNDDGNPDWFVTNIDMFSKSIKVIFPTSETTVNVDGALQRAFQYIAGNKLYLGAATARERLESVELQVFEPGDKGWGWDAAFFDYELDGDEDVYLVNGWIEGSYAADQANQMYIRDGGFYFLAPSTSAEAFEGNSRSVAAADFDRDGDVDLLVNNFRQAPRVYQNTQTSGNHWLRVHLKGRAPNVAAAGARVRVAAGGQQQTRWTTIGDGYLGQDGGELIFGLGKATKADVEVTWASGQTTKLSSVAPGDVSVEEGP